ncbi:hypothetical protein [Bacillus toyonensis]|nr:hypothetical protein [Bacillus toyonensis]
MLVEFLILQKMSVFPDLKWNKIEKQADLESNGVKRCIIPGVFWIYF